MHNIQKRFLNVVHCWMCIWETAKEPKRNHGSSSDLFLNSFKQHKKKSSNGKSTGGGCCSGERGVGVNQPFFTSDIWTNCFGMRVNSFDWLKSAGFSRFTPRLPLRSLDHTVQLKQNYTGSEECVTFGVAEKNKMITEWVLLDRKQSWKAKNRGTCPQSFSGN